MLANKELMEGIDVGNYSDFERLLKENYIS
jgi:hypothetical protein